MLTRWGGERNGTFPVADPPNILPGPRRTFRDLNRQRQRGPSPRSRWLAQRPSGQSASSRRAPRWPPSVVGRNLRARAGTVPSLSHRLSTSGADHATWGYSTAFPLVRSVSAGRLELPRAEAHMALNHARLPVPPRRRGRPPSLPVALRCRKGLRAGLSPLPSWVQARP
jgi:hypothetical protein